MGTYVNIGVDVDIDVDEVIENLSTDQKQHLLETLIDELGQKAALTRPTTHTEAELQAALAQLWESRHLLTRNQINRIIEMTNESYIDG